MEIDVTTDFEGMDPLLENVCQCAFRHQYLEELQIPYLCARECVLWYETGREYYRALTVFFVIQNRKMAGAPVVGAGNVDVAINLLGTAPTLRHAWMDLRKHFHNAYGDVLKSTQES